jgi:HEAT repeat protein
LLLLASIRTTGAGQILLWIGTSFQLLVCVLSFVSRASWQASIGPSLVALYLIALGWMWLGDDGKPDWYFHLSQATLLLVPLCVFAVQTLTSSGAPTLRRARLLAQSLANRTDWPADLTACRSLPIVKALREALALNATPALSLLQHPRVEVRVAALAALEFRRDWQPGQAELVLHVARRAKEPPVRAAAVMALANHDSRAIVEDLAEFLRDPAWEVRKAAMEALLWDCERRWPWIRQALRAVLADPAYQSDGPVPCDGVLLTPEALADFNAWAAEKGVLGIRAALTLGGQYGRALSEQADQRLVAALQEQLADSHTAPTLRMEIARLLQAHGQLEPDLLRCLLNATNPAPLRLIAVDTLLADGHHPEALSALCEVARLPNREIALATAEVVQRRLGVDLGLPPGQTLPALHSRQAAEVTRRVMAWATQQALVSC